MRRFVGLPAAFAGGFVCFSTIAQAADPSMSVLTSGRDGKSRVLLDSGSSAPFTSPGDFRVLVGNGGAYVETVTPFGSAAVHTTLAFDVSGSFKAHLPAAVQLGRDFVHGLPPGGHHTTGVLTLGAGIRELGEGKSEVAVTHLLDRVTAEPAQHLTRLKGLLIQTVDLVKSRPAPVSLRQIIVFTDGLDESSQFQMDDVIRPARASGVRIHVVEFSGLAATRARTAVAQTTTATGLDATMSLAVNTGGVHLDGAAPGAPAGLLEIAQSHGRMVWLDVGFCGVTSASPIFDDTLSIELTSTGVATPKLSFSQSISSVSIAPCAVPAAGTAAPVAAIGQPASDPPGNPGPSTGISWWWWLVAAGFALAVATLGVVLLRPSRGASVPPAVVRPPPEPPVTPQPTPQLGDHDTVEPERDLGGGVPLGVLSELPETQLHVVRGPPEIVSQGYLRINRSRMVVGGFKEEGVDLVLQVPQISTRHAQFQLYPNGTLWLEDLGSKNGTYVNDRRMASGERISVAPGDRIMLSNQVEFRVEQPGRAPPPPVQAVSREPASREPASEARSGVKTTYAPIGSSPAAAPPSTSTSTSTSPSPPRPKHKTQYAPVKNPGEES